MGLGDDFTGCQCLTMLSQPLSAFNLCEPSHVTICTFHLLASKARVCSSMMSYVFLRMWGMYVCLSHSIEVKWKQRSSRVNQNTWLRNALSIYIFTDNLIKQSVMTCYDMFPLLRFASQYSSSVIGWNYIPRLVGGFCLWEDFKRPQWT